MPEFRAIRIIAPIAVAFALTAGSTVAKADMALEVLASNCAVCHGQKGASHGTTPELTGMTAAKIAKTMMEFKSGAKAATIMNRITKGYSDDQIAALAGYFGSGK